MITSNRHNDKNRQISGVKNHVLVFTHSHKQLRSDCNESQSANFSVDLSTNPGVTMWCVCGCR